MTEKTTRSKQPQNSIEAAVEAFQRGYTAVPIRNGGKAPYGANWTHLRWTSAEQVRQAFEGWAKEGAESIGLSLGEASGGLVDVDLDHVMALRLRDHFLPPSPMQTGRPGRPRSHRWYICEGEIPSTRQYKMPDKSISVELRSTGGQTLIPPSVWWPKDKTPPVMTEKYRWEGPAWGGAKGPARIEGRKLAVQVALLGLGAVLLENWPRQGSRHEAYLALAGGLLRYGDGVHPFWEKHLHVLIGALADVTHDEDGADARVSEVMGSTLTKLREGGKAVGFPKLAELIGTDHAELARRRARDVESLAGFVGTPMTRIDGAPSPAQGVLPFTDEPLMSTLDPATRNPLEERINSWAAVDLEPYLSGEVVVPEPTVLVREDGRGIFYPGRVNSLFGLSESAKSWISLQACAQEIGKGDRVIYIDFEDEPAGTLSRALALGVGPDDLKNQFRYVHPEGPIADMQRYRFGAAATDEGRAAASTFRALLDAFDPTLIIADGMTVLYGLHGHDTNEATATDVITQWLKSITRGGRTCVIVIDHTGKGGGAGSSPIGAHHKVAMVQGTAIRADKVDRPMPGAVGRVRLIVFKDRPGAVREYSTKADEQVCADILIDSTTKGVTKMSIRVPDPDEVVIGESEAGNRRLARLAEQAELENRVIALFEGDVDKQLTTKIVCDTLGVDPDSLYDVWSALKARNVISQHGATRWTHYRLVPPLEATPVDPKEG